MIRSTAKITLTVLFVTALTCAVVMLHDILLLGFAAVLVAIILSFPVGWASRFINRSAAVILALILLIGIVAAGTVLTVPLLTKQAHQLSEKLPTAVSRIDDWFNRAKEQVPMVQPSQAQKIETGLKSRITAFMEQAVSKTIPAAIGTVSVISGLIYLMVLAAFLTADPHAYRDSFAYLLSARLKPFYFHTWDELGRRLRGWLRGILISMSIMGSLAAIGLWLVGIEDWPLLGILTFIGTFVPYLGAIASAVPGLLLGLAQSPRHLVLAAIVYLGVHLVEGYIIEPLVMKRVVELRPGLLLFWLLTMSAIFGPIGMAIGTPLLVCVKTLVECTKEWKWAKET